MTTASVVETDRFDARSARRAPAVLRAFNDAGVLTAADVHVAMGLARLSGGCDDAVLLAAALAVRGPRLGHVCVDLAAVRGTISVDTDIAVDLHALPWPEPAGWLDQVSRSAMVASGDAATAVRPLRLVRGRLYLDRYWREEREVAAALIRLAGAAPPGVDEQLLRAGLGRLFPGDAPDLQRLAAASVVLRHLTVVAGGPGTGKTTTVAQVLALLHEQAAASREPLVALAAPTGKAAARLQEAVHAAAADLDVSAAVRDRLLATQASTLHRLLGRRPGSHSRFRHDRDNRLPHDVVIVDETSMVSLSLMARLLEALRSDARLVLVGDPEQLASVEAGAVLGDIVGPASERLLMHGGVRARLADVTGHPVDAAEPPAGSSDVGDGIVVLRRVHRFGGGIAALADAVRRADVDEAVRILGSAHEDVEWIPVDVADASAAPALTPVREAAVAAGRRVFDAARARELGAALAGLGEFRILCAHRRGAHGVAPWTDRVERWLAAEIDGYGVNGPWYLGRPLLVTENDYGLRLFNGDTGVVVAGGDQRASLAFERGGEVLEFSPTQLGAVATVHAMTVHRSQGSQFAVVAVLLPDPASPVLTRELLYTAITRARGRLILAGTEAAVAGAIRRPVARASGLGERLWAAPRRSHWISPTIPR